MKAIIIEDLGILNEYARPWMDEDDICRAKVFQNVDNSLYYIEFAYDSGKKNYSRPFRGTQYYKTDIKAILRLFGNVIRMSADAQNPKEINWDLVFDASWMSMSANTREGHEKLASAKTKVKDLDNRVKRLSDPQGNYRASIFLHPGSHLYYILEFNENGETINYLGMYPTADIAEMMWMKAQEPPVARNIHVPL